MDIGSQINGGSIRCGSDVHCPTCGKKFVGFDVGTAIMYLCPRCKTPEQFDEEIHKAECKEVGMKHEIRDKETGNVLLRWKIDDDRHLLMYSMTEPGDPMAKDALFGLKLSFEMANAGSSDGYQMLDVGEHRRDIMTTKFYVVKAMIAEWRKAHGFPD